MKSLYLLIALLATSLTASAQQRFVPATVYLHSGDSLTGEMDYRKWDAEPSAVNFRSNGAVTVYTPDMLTGFRIHENDERYRTIAGDLDITRETIEVLTTEKTRTIGKGPHFFRIVLHGPAQLLQHTDKHMRRHFAIQTPDTLLHLIREVRYIDDPESPYNGKLQTIDHFRQQLDFFTDGCRIKTRLDMLEYRAESITKVLIQYTACKHPGTVVAAPRKDPVMRNMWGVMGGISLNTFRISGNHFVAGNNFKSSMSPTAGIFLDIPLSRRRQQFALNTELKYSNIKMQSDGKRDKVDINFDYLTLLFMLRYTYPVGEVRPYISGGTGLMKKLGSGTDLYQRQGNNTVTVALDGGRQLMVPLFAAAGVRYKRWNGEVRVTLPHQLDELMRMAAWATTSQLLVRYILRQ